MHKHWLRRVCAFLGNPQTGFDPVVGRKEELARFDNSRAELSWSLSPDGKKFALVENMNHHVAVLTLASKQNGSNSFDASVGGHSFVD